MSDHGPSSLPIDPQAAVQLLQAELAETNREMLLLTLELDARVEARTAELKIAHQELEKTNAELVKVALELERRVEERTQAVRESEDRFRSMADGAPVIIWVTDAEGGIRFVNRTYREFFGVPLDQVEGGKWQPLVHPEDADAYIGAFRDAVRAQVPFRAETRTCRADGEWRWIASYAEPRFSAAGQFLGHAGISTDVTERKRAEAALREADDRKNDFIAILSHELRNPLAPIRYALPLLQRERLGEQAARAVAVIERQLDHMARLVDDLLDVSRITRGKIELRREVVTLGALVSAAIEAASPAISAARHRLQSTVTEAPVWLDADPARIAQVITNLLNNSAKYTPRGGQISVEAGRDGVQAVIRVRDNGMGIPKESLATIFEMFRQIDGPGRSQGGLGIGLALARQLVEMHGGTIQAFSAGPGRGAEFVVRLPMARDPSVFTGGEARATTVSARRLKVLVVDDNADLVEMLTAVITGLGHEVRKAHDGQTALAAALSFRPDVVLLDLGLPLMGGIQVARELRRRPETSDVRLVALTGWGQAEDRRDTSEAGFDYHLTKPTDPKILERLLLQFASEQ